MHAMLDRADVIVGLRKHVNDACIRHSSGDALTNHESRRATSGGAAPRRAVPLRCSCRWRTQRRNRRGHRVFAAFEFIKKNIQPPSAYTRNIDASAEAG